LLLYTDKRGRSEDPEIRFLIPFLILSLLDNLPCMTITF
jgi:hypothetical protein